MSDTRPSDRVLRLQEKLRADATAPSRSCRRLSTWGVLILEQELATCADVDLDQADQALACIDEMLDAPRDQWAPPSDAWERLCTALALAVRRCEAWWPRPGAIARVRAAAAEIRKARAAA